MPWDEIFWMLGLLVAVTIFGQLWFRFVEFLLERTKRFLFRPPVWHTLPDEKEDGNGHQ